MLYKVFLLFFAWIQCSFKICMQSFLILLGKLPKWHQCWMPVRVALFGFYTSEAKAKCLIYKLHVALSKSKQQILKLLLLRLNVCCIIIYIIYWKCLKVQCPMTSIGIEKSIDTSGINEKVFGIVSKYIYNGIALLRGQLRYYIFSCKCKF